MGESQTISSLYSRSRTNPNIYYIIKYIKLPLKRQEHATCQWWLSDLSMVKGFSAFKAMEKNHTRGKTDRSGHIRVKLLSKKNLI